jgi:hypothetical protein
MTKVLSEHASKIPSLDLLKSADYIARSRYAFNQLIRYPVAAFAAHAETPKYRRGRLVE